MNDLLKDQEQLTDALQTVQRLYMKVKNKLECVEFYTKRIQPIYAEFEANEENKEQEQALYLSGVIGWLLFSESKPTKMQRIMYEGNCGGIEAFYLYDNNDGTGTVNLDHGGTDIFERWQACH